MAPDSTVLDAELLAAFAPEFEAAAAQLGAAADGAAAARALDQLRAMAAALGSPSLIRLVAEAEARLDPFDADGVRAAAAALAARGAAIAATGKDEEVDSAASGERALSPAEAAASAALPAATVAAAAQAPGIDPELLAAFLPEFDAAAERLAAATDEASAARALEALRGMAGAIDLASLRAMLEAATAFLDPFDDDALRDAAAALRRHAAAVAEAGHDLPPPEASVVAPGPARDAPAAVAGDAAAAPRRVLVVDDSALMRRLVRDTLAADPAFAVIGEAADGARALEAMRELSPDLTMLDIEMPVLDGIGVLRRWALEGTGAVVVVSSAARPGSATAIELRRLGAAAVVGKPSGAFSPDLAERQGDAIRRAARRAAGLPAEGG